jgi:hypothetical protein
MNPNSKNNLFKFNTILLKNRLSYAIKNYFQKLECIKSKQPKYHDLPSWID